MAIDGLSREDKLKKLDETRLRLEKEFGKNTLIKLDGSNIEKVECYSTGILGLDEMLGGGGGKGRVMEIFGPESCLAWNTFIRYQVRDGERCQNSKGGSIEKLYDRFHNTGKGQSARKQNNNTSFYVSSINEENCLFKNKVADVVFTGEKECFEVITASGKKIEATKDHKFYVGNGEYSVLDNLTIGDIIYTYIGERNKKEKLKKFKYLEVCVKYHPANRFKKVTANNRKGEKVYSYDRYRVRKSRLVYEAKVNNLSYEEYLTVLNTKGKEEIDKLWFVPFGKAIHHIDGNHRNDVIDNLILLSTEEHNRYHSLVNHNDLRFKVSGEKIVSIKSVGFKKTYDIKCFSPYNNYMANDFIVHNCGKTTLALEITAEAQRNGHICAFIDAEHALDPAYAQNMGVDVDNLWLSQPDSGEQALTVAEDLIDSGAVSIVVIDSTAALVPQKEIDGEMGDSNMGLQARLLSQAMRKLTGKISKNGVLVIFISQIRMKIGVMFGSPEVMGVGNALKFYATQRIDIRKGETQTEGEEATANIVKVKIIKNKIAPPFRKGEFIINFGKGFDKMDDLVNQAIKYDVVQKSGSWFSMGETRLGQGKPNVTKFFEENPEVYKDVYAQVKAKIQEKIGAEKKSEAPIKEKKRGKAEKAEKDKDPEMVLDQV
jgi:recombination protein RecA